MGFISGMKIVSIKVIYPVLETKNKKTDDHFSR